jgi:hypothetical protein
VSGEYIIIPKSQEEDYRRSMDKLIAQHGYVGDRNAKGVPEVGNGN